MTEKDKIKADTLINIHNNLDFSNHWTRANSIGFALFSAIWLGMIACAVFGI